LRSGAWLPNVATIHNNALSPAAKVDVKVHILTFCNLLDTLGECPAKHDHSCNSGHSPSACAQDHIQFNTSLKLTSSRSVDQGDPASCAARDWLVYLTHQHYTSCCIVVLCYQFALTRLSSTQVLGVFADNFTACFALCEASFAHGKFQTLAPLRSTYCVSTRGNTPLEVDQRLWR
jgi:hypothetical protein